MKTIATKVFLPGVKQQSLSLSNLARDVNTIKGKLDDLLSDEDVYREIWVVTEAFKAPGTKPATAAEVGLAGAWEFSDATDDTLICRLKFPSDRKMGKALFFGIGWCTPTASAGNCRWDIAYLFAGDNQDTSSTTPDATLSATAAASSTAYGLVRTRLGPTIVPEDSDVCMCLQIKRQAGEAADTLGEDNYLLGMSLRYVSKDLERGS